MKQDNLNLGNLFLGLIILGFGILTLAELFGFLGFDFIFDFSYFLPILFVWAGFFILRPSQNFYFLSLFFVIIITLFFFYSIFQFGFENNGVLKEKIEVESVQGLESLLLDINIGAGELRLNGGGEKILEGTFSSDFSILEKNISLQGNTEIISLFTKINEDISFGKSKNALDLSVNSNINSEVTINSGASNLDLDLEDIKLDYLKINSGASKINIILPQESNESKIEIEAGASSINIVSPYDLGVRIVAESGIFPKTIKDFEEVNNSEYLSLNYHASANKVDIYLDLGISDFNIEYK